MADAWVFCDNGSDVSMMRKDYEISSLGDDELLLKPLYGSLEGNIVHAFNKFPEDVFSLRCEKEIVMGNAGVMLVSETGRNISDLQKGDLCIYFCNGEPDRYGYPKKITGYDKKGSMGVMAKTIRLNRNEVIKIPKNSSISLPQWAIFSLKFITAWSNWKLAYNAYHIQLPEVSDEEISVWGWGGGVSYAEIRLAQLMGCRAGLITSKQSITQLCTKHGIDVLDRKIRNNSLKKFRKAFFDKAGSEGASIFVDNIGAETYQDTMRFLSREGVIATNGWKDGAVYPVIRSSECINRHIHVHTHYASMSEGFEAVEFALNHDWIPQYTGRIYDFDSLPELMEDYRCGKLENYFTVFQINN